MMQETPSSWSPRLHYGLDFVFRLHLMMLILGHANSLSLSLLRKDKDILEAMMEFQAEISAN